MTSTWQVLAVLVLASAAPVSAQSETNPDELVRRGVSEREAGRDEAALALFTEAYTRSRSPVALAQMAAAEQALGRWLLAEQHMGEALAQTEHPYIQRNRATLEAAYAVIRRRVGTLIVTANVEGATAWVDGELVATLPREAPVRLLVGAHRLEVRAAGHYPVSRPIDVGAESPSREEVTLRATLAVAPENGQRSEVPVVVAPVDSVERGPRTQTWVLWGAGLLAVTGGAIAHGLREAAAGRYNTQCVGPQDPSTACTGLRDEGAVELGAAIGGYLLGAGLFTWGTLDALLPRQVSVAATPARGGMAFVVGGRF